MADKMDDNCSKMIENSSDSPRKPPEDSPSFENVLEELGSFGRFQFTQLTIGFLGSFITAYMTMSFVFLGYEPSHVCRSFNGSTHLLSTRHVPNDSFSGPTPPVHVIYGSCDVSIRTTNHSNGVGNNTVNDVISKSCPNGRTFPGAEHTTFLSEWDLVCESMGQAEVSHLIFTIGQLIGGLIVSAVADLLGRKPVLITTSFFAFLAELSTVVAPNIHFVYGIRFFSGLFVQGLSCCFFVHGMEWLLPKHRQIYGVVICIIWVLQLLLVGAAAFLLQDYSWRYFQGVGAASGIMFFLYPLFLYESPRWLAVRYRFKESLRILEKASKVNGKNFAKVEEVFSSYTEHYCKETTEKYVQDVDYDSENVGDDRISSKEKGRGSRDSLLRLFSHRKALMMTLTAWYLWITHNVTYYGLYMMSSELVGNRFFNYSLMALVEIPSNLLILYVMTNIRRRLVLRLFLGLAAACLLASIILVFTRDSSSGTHSVLSSILFVAGKFAISASFNVLYIITPEIFPTTLRVTGSGSCTSVDKIGSMVAPFLRPLSSIVAWGPGVIFTSMCLVALCLTPMIPETKDTNLPSTLRDSEKTPPKTRKDWNANQEIAELSHFGDAK